MADSRPTTIINPWPVINAIRAEAAKSAHLHVGSEHVALAALGGPDGLEAMAAKVGLDPRTLRPALETCCLTPPVAEPAKAHLTPRVAAIVAVAAQLAQAEGVSEIRARHLVGGLFLHPDCIAWRALASVGLGPGAAASVYQFPVPAAAQPTQVRARLD